MDSFVALLPVAVSIFELAIGQIDTRSAFTDLPWGERACLLLVGAGWELLGDSEG